MNTAIAARWVAALRSGKYYQGMNLLRQHHDATDTHCCLGVLCELYLEDHPGSPLAPELRPDIDLPTPENGTAYSYGEDDHELPPAAIREWAELRPHSCDALAEQNDNGTSFEELANLIEREATQL